MGQMELSALLIPSHLAALTTGTKYYTTFNITATNTVTVTPSGTTPLIIYCKTSCTISGTLKLNGSDGQSWYLSTNPSDTGIGCGESSNYRTSPNVKYSTGATPLEEPEEPEVMQEQVEIIVYRLPPTEAHLWHRPVALNKKLCSRQRRIWNCRRSRNRRKYRRTYLWQPSAFSFYGGSGGGAGGGNPYEMPTPLTGSAGGGGGGAVEIIAPTITINTAGVITANGGVGGGGSGPGGGGSGGAIWLRTPTLINNGTVQAVGGIGGCASEYNYLAGTGGYGRIRLDYQSNTGINYNPLPGYVGTFPYADYGTLTTAAISPTDLCSWGTLMYNVNTPAGTTFTVNILSCATCTGVPLATNVSSGANLSSIPNVATATSIYLEGVFTTTNTSATPTLYSWSVSYTY